jgi:hypothetical protein
MDIPTFEVYETMTALNFLFEPDRVCIVMDTLMVRPDTRRPLLYTSKIFTLPHLGGVMCGTGVMQLVIDWFVCIQTAVIVRDIPHLDQYAPNQLRAIAGKYDLNSKLTSTIYHFGYSEIDQRYRGFAYRSEKNFISEELEYGFGIKPPVEFEPIQSLPKGFVEMMEQQRIEDRKKPTEDQVGIGGDIHLFVMTPEQMVLTRCHRFEDYESCYSKMLENLRTEKG